MNRKLVEKLMAEKWGDKRNWYRVDPLDPFTNFWGDERIKKCSFELACDMAIIIGGENTDEEVTNEEYGVNSVFEDLKKF